MFQKVDDANRVRAFPAVLERNVRHQRVDGIVQRKMSAIGQVENRERDELLGDRADAEQCLGRGRAPIRDVRHTQTCEPRLRIAANDDNRRSGRIAFFENAPDLGAQFLRRRCTLPRLNRVSRRGDEQGAGQNGFRT